MTIAIRFYDEIGTCQVVSTYDEHKDSDAIATLIASLPDGWSYHIEDIRDRTAEVMAEFAEYQETFMSGVVDDALWQGTVSIGYDN